MKLSLMLLLLGLSGVHKMPMLTLPGYRQSMDPTIHPASFFMINNETQTRKKNSHSKFQEIHPKNFRIYSTNCSKISKQIRTCSSFHKSH